MLYSRNGIDFRQLQFCNQDRGRGQWMFGMEVDPGRADSDSGGRTMNLLRPHNCFLRRAPSIPRVRSTRCFVGGKTTHQKPPPNAYNATRASIGQTYDRKHPLTPPGGRSLDVQFLAPKFRRAARYGYLKTRPLIAKRICGELIKVDALDGDHIKTLAARELHCEICVGYRC